MTAEEFKAATGVEPTHDDLERANCPKAGEFGHWACGVCKDHGKPVFACTVCMEKAVHEKFNVKPKEKDRG